MRYLEEFAELERSIREASASNSESVRWMTEELEDWNRERKAAEDVAADVSLKDAKDNKPQTADVEPPKAKTTPAEPATQPADLWNKFNPPPLKRGLLPKVIEDFAFDKSKLMGTDPSGLAMASLVVCAAAIPDKIKLKVKRHDSWMESARIWGTLVGPPSAKKSPTLSEAKRPLGKIDYGMSRTYFEAKARWDAMSKEERRNAQPPKQTRSILEDTTFEAAQEVMKDSPDGVMVFRDELSGWFGSMDKYSGHRGAAEGRNIQILLAGRRPTMWRRDSDPRRNSSRNSPTSFLRRTHPSPRRCCAKPAPSPSFLRPSPIRSAAVSSRAFRGPEATPLVSPILRHRRPASGWGCSRRSRRTSIEPPSCSTLRRAPYADYLSSFKSSALSFSVEAIAAPVHSTSEFEPVFSALARDPNGGLVVMTDTFLSNHHLEITSLAARYRVPAVYPYRLYTEVGGLLSYGNDTRDNFRRAAAYVDRFLKGTKPSELPVQATVKFELVINLKAARAIGIIACQNC